jgi:hypothetical protein
MHFLNSADDQTGAKIDEQILQVTLRPLWRIEPQKIIHESGILAETERQSASDEKQGIRTTQPITPASRSYGPCPTFIFNRTRFSNCRFDLCAAPQMLTGFVLSGRSGSLLGHIGRSCYRGEGRWGCFFESWRCSGSSLRADSGRRCGGSLRADSSRRCGGSWCLRSYALRCCEVFALEPLRCHAREQALTVAEPHRGLFVACSRFGGGRYNFCDADGADIGEKFTESDTGFGPISVPGQGKRIKIAACAIGISCGANRFAEFCHHVVATLARIKLCEADWFRAGGLHHY